MGVLGTRSEVVATSLDPPGSTPGVLGISLEVHHTPPGVVGIPPEVLGTAPEVLGSVTGVLDQVLDDKGAGEAASFPHARTALVPSRLLVEHDVA